MEWRNLIENTVRLARKSTCERGLNDAATDGEHVFEAARPDKNQQTAILQNSPSCRITQ
jgi:hypothetical protein